MGRRAASRATKRSRLWKTTENKRRKAKRKPKDIRDVDYDNVNLLGGVEGDPLRPKEEGMIRLVCDNFDNLNITTNYEGKLGRLRGLARRTEADLLMGSEVGVNWSAVEDKDRLDERLATETALRLVTAHNEHENHGKIQRGGTCLMVFDAICSTVATMGTDVSGLGRWCWVLLEGKEGHKTYVLAAYQPCRSSTGDDRMTVWAQQRRYFRNRESLHPIRAFRRDLLRLIRQWRENGDRVVLLLDANEDMDQGPLQRKLERLGFRDAIKARRDGRRGPATHFRNTKGKKIDACWISEDIEDGYARYLRFYAGIGDHRAMVIDVPSSSVLGGHMLKVARPVARRLNGNIKATKEKYNSDLEGYVAEHKLLTRAEALYVHSGFPLSPEQIDCMNKLDDERKQMMMAAEKKCRKLRMGGVEFSPTVDAWGKRWALWKLVERHKRSLIERRRNNSGVKPVSRSLIKRRAKIAGVEKPLSVTHEEAQWHLTQCRRMYLSLKPQAFDLRQEFLAKRVVAAMDANDEKAIEDIKRIIRNEKLRKAWRLIKRAEGRKRSGSVKDVEVMENGEWVRKSNKAEVEEGIMSENTKRFRLTNDTPVMSGQLLEDFGYLADTEAAEEVLAGTYDPPEDADEHTKALLSLLKQRVEMLRQGKIKTCIMREDFKRYWRGAKESTSSSISGLHFGHYKAAASSDTLSEFHAIMTDIAYNGGHPLQRWTKGLSVMLEKIKGNIRVNKLRAILLMEADFNFANKLILGSRMIKNGHAAGLIPTEQYGGLHNKCSAEVGLNRRLFLDLLRLQRRNGALASVDAANCYDRMCHSIVSLCCQYFGVPAPPLICMLLAIQLMKFYLRTSFGDSDDSYGGDRHNPFQGCCQGNGGAPAAWVAVSTLLVLYLKMSGCEARFTTAISAVMFSFAALIFVDDTDLPVVGDTMKSSPTHIGAKMQRSASVWAGGLRVTGGALKPEKCYWYMVVFEWFLGEWRHAKKERCPYEIQVPDALC